VAWATIFVSVSAVTFGNWNHINIVFQILLIGFLLLLFTFFVISTRRIKNVKRASTIFYCLLLRKQFGLNGKDETGDETFDFANIATQFRRNIDSIDMIPISIAEIEQLRVESLELLKKDYLDGLPGMIRRHEIILNRNPNK
jgi:hypothetical protein